jgi:hypothetical protein
MPITHFWPLLLALLFAGLNNLYLCLLIHWRYQGQFGLWFLMPCAVVFSLPTLIVAGLPAYLVLIAPASELMRIGLGCLLLFLCLRLQSRLTRLFLNRRFPAVPTNQSSDNGEA